jgi:hypothetical protein
MATEKEIAEQTKRTKAAADTAKQASADLKKALELVTQANASAEQAKKELTGEDDQE